MEAPTPWEQLETQARITEVDIERRPDGDPYKKALENFRTLVTDRNIEGLKDFVNSHPRMWVQHTVWTILKRMNVI